MSNVMNTYGRLDIAFEKGKGCYLYDTKGKKYIDFLAGIAVCSLGHTHPELVKILKKQSEKLWHTSNLYRILPQEKLAEKICKLSGLSTAFFCNSGAEANEAAIKMIRKYHNTKKTGRKEIICMKNSFHGRTLATLSATGQFKYQKGFEPLVSGFKFAEFNNSKNLIKNISKKTGAIFLELIQGEGGVIPATKEFINTINKIKRKNKDILVVIDEVQSGVGRTGDWFAFQKYNCSPDAITLAKGLGGGFPIGALVCAKSCKDVLVPGTHASTFGGNFLACSTALGVLDIIQKQKILKNVNKMGKVLKKELERVFSKYEGFKEVRGTGFMLGVLFDREVSDIIKKLYKVGVIAGSAGTNIIRFVPPLIMGEKEIKEAIEKIEKIRS